MDEGEGELMRKVGCLRGEGEGKEVAPWKGGRMIKKELIGDGGRMVDAEPAGEEVVREFNLEEMSPRD